MLEVLATKEFEAWLGGLADRSSKARILRRLDRLAGGNLGDVRPIGKGLSELRIHAGPGYRVYFIQEGQVLVLLLCGGDKSSQPGDIVRAHHLAAQWKAEMPEMKERNS